MGMLQSVSGRSIPLMVQRVFCGGDQYAVALALVDCGEVKVAALACPALPVDMEEMEGDCGVLFVAVRGEGSRAMPLAGGDVADVRIDDPAWRFAESVESSHGDHDAQQSGGSGGWVLFRRRSGWIVR